MSTKESFFTESKKEIEDYLQNRLLLLKMQTADKTAKLVATLSIGLALSLLGFFILLFLSIMAGYFFANLTGSLYVGFGIVASTYILLFLVLFFARKKLTAFLIDAVIQVFFDQDETTS